MSEKPVPDAEGVVRCTLAQWLEHGPALVREADVNHVFPSDCEPSAAGTFTSPFAAIPGSLDRSIMPMAIWEHLPSATGPSRPAYASRDDATEALSHALIAWATWREA